MAKPNMTEILNKKSVKAKENDNSRGLLIVIVLIGWLLIVEEDLVLIAIIGHY